MCVCTFLCFLCVWCNVTKCKQEVQEQEVVPESSHSLAERCKHWSIKLKIKIPLFSSVRLSVINKAVVLSTVCVRDVLTWKMHNTHTICVYIWPQKTDCIRGRTDDEEWALIWALLTGPEEPGNTSLHRRAYPQGRRQHETLANEIQPLSPWQHNNGKHKEYCWSVMSRESRGDRKYWEKTATYSTYSVEQKVLSNGKMNVCFMLVKLREIIMAP